MRALYADKRFVTRTDGISSAHCFSFGAHFDPTRTGFGPVLACNDERLDPGSGYALHRHRDVEIVSWVLGGTLTHEDSTGSRHDLSPGTVQRLSAGEGVEHAERNLARDQPLRFVQFWLRPDRTGGVPTYGWNDGPVPSGMWTDVVGGSAALGIGVTGAVMRVALLPDQAQLPLLQAPQTFLFVVAGSLSIAGHGDLADGDALLVSGDAVTVQAREHVEVIAWELPADP